MELKIKDIVDFLQVSEKTVYRWIKEKKIPCYRINHQYRFNKAEINEWILSNKIELSASLIHLSNSDGGEGLSRLLERGGIISGIAGGSVREVLEDAVKKINGPQSISKEEILSALLRREELMPTAIGKGIAIPHPRNPVITDIKTASVSICYLETAVDFGALDSQPVHTLFILLTASPKMHLEVLSKISYLCQDETFYRLLQDGAQKDVVMEYIRNKEAAWNKKAVAVS